MQIGNPDLDQICGEAIVPALKACGLEPKRVDKHNQGGLLKSEIISFIQDASIIVADLTNERPNCYLEIGYAMGVDKFRNLLLTVREDHFPESPNHRSGGPKVHFDLGGYDILAWSPDQPELFRSELEKRIRRRLATLPSQNPEQQDPWDQEWLAVQRAVSINRLASIGREGFMELRLALEPPKPELSLAQLNEATTAAPMRVFGWSIAPYMTKDEFRPRPRPDGITATIHTKTIRESYDYWAARKNGDFYWLGTLVEDQGEVGRLFFNIRIARVAEALLYTVRLYSALGIDRSTRVGIGIRHGGLTGRYLATSNLNRDLTPRGPIETAQMDKELFVPLDSIESHLVEYVKSVCAPLFEQFAFFTLNDVVYEDIVNRFVAGEVT